MIKTYKMISIKKYSLIAFAALLGFSSCEKNEIGFTKDQKPAVAVLVSNATDYRAEPTVTTSLAGGGNIQIVLTTSPARTIKSVAFLTNTTYSGIQGIAPVPVAYTGSPATVNATTFTLNTTITQYFALYPVSASNPAAAANTELARRFYFAVTLDDGTVLISEPVRVLVLA
jgi:hypothetical protein